MRRHRPDPARRRRGGGAVSGAAGSIASQAIGVAAGIQDKFSWKSVALSALQGGIGGGLGKLGALAQVGIATEDQDT